MTLNSEQTALVELLIIAMNDSRIGSELTEMLMLTCSTAETISGFLPLDKAGRLKSKALELFRLAKDNTMFYVSQMALEKMHA